VPYGAAAYQYYFSEYKPLGRLLRVMSGMRKSKFSETQIVEMLKDAGSGVAVADLLRKHGVSKATFFKWRSKYGGASDRT